MLEFYVLNRQCEFHLMKSIKKLKYKKFFNKKIWCNILRLNFYINYDSI